MFVIKRNIYNIYYIIKDDDFTFDSSNTWQEKEYGRIKYWKSSTLYCTMDYQCSRQILYLLTCPICQKGKSIIQYRYPKMVCSECSSKTKTPKGERVEFSNNSHSGGLMACIDEKFYEITDPLTFPVWIYNHECFVEEGRFGGIIIQSTK